MIDVSDFLSAIQGVARSDLPPGMKLATISPFYVLGSMSSPTLPTVVFDGETVLTTKQYPIIAGYIPYPNDRVVMVPVGRTYVIVGAVSTTRNPPPRVKVYLNTNVAGIPNASVGAVQFDSNALTSFEQPAGLWHSHVTNPSRVTIPTGYGGLVTCKWAITYSAAANGQRSADLYLNGTFHSAATNVFPGAVSAAICVNGTNDLEVAAGDYLEVAFFQSSGGTVSLTAGIGLTYLSVIWRGPLG